MNLPAVDFEVKVGAFWFEVIYSHDVTDDGGNFGCIHYNDQKMFLDPSAKQQKREQAFLHELLHACMWVSGLLYRFAGEQKPTEEDVTRELSMMLYQSIQDNKELFAEEL